MKYAFKKSSLCNNLLKIKKGPLELQQVSLTSIRQKGGTQRALAHCILVLNLVFQARHQWSKSFFRTLVSSHVPRSSCSFSSLHIHLLALLLLLHLSHHYPCLLLLYPFSSLPLPSLFPMAHKSYSSLPEPRKKETGIHPCYACTWPPRRFRLQWKFQTLLKGVAHSWE